MLATAISILELIIWNKLMNSRIVLL